MPEAVPTVLVGLDGATFDVIDPLVNEGRLPFMGQMMGRGARATLLSSTPPLSAIAWTTITSGVNPGKHGIYDFAHRQKGSYDFVPYTARDKKAPSLWKMLGDAGRKSCIVNVPLTYPAEPLRGVMLSGFPRPPNATDGAYPASIQGELERELGDVDFSKPGGLIRDGQESELVEEIQRKTEVQLKIIEYLLKRDSYDFVMTVFDGVDVASHSLWKFIDPLHPKYDPTRSKDVRELLFRAYEISDRALGTVRGMFKGDANFIALSDHGNGPVYYGVYINNWLADKGYLKFKRTVRTKAKRWMFRRGVNVYNMYRLAHWLGVLPGIEEAYTSRSFALGLVKRLALSFDDIDWEKTRVYSFGNYGQLFVNLKGREPRGIVEPGSEYEVLMDQLMAGIKDLRDERTQEQIFDEVYRGSALYSGAWEADGPDILFFDKNMLYTPHRIFELATNKLVTPHPLYSGNHKPEGVLMALGPAVLRASPAGPCGIADITPTMLSLQGVDPKAAMDGTPLLKMFRTKPPGAKVVRSDAESKPAQQVEALTDAENRELSQRLKDLGYI